MVQPAAPARERSGMATERLAMRQIREILRQKWVVGCSHRQVTASLRISLGTVTAVLRRGPPLPP